MATGTTVVTWLALLATGQLPAGEEVHHVNIRNPEIPIILPQDPVKRGQIKSLALYASTDQGKSWNQVAVAGPTQAGFPYVAPADGQYWFQVVSLDQRGVSDPPVEQISTLPAALRMIVDTRKPMVKLNAERKGDQVTAAWQVDDDHLNLNTLRLEYQTSESVSWTPVPIIPATATGTRSWNVSSAGAVTVRLMVQDAAENTASDEKRLPAEPIVPASIGTAPPPVPPTSPFAGPPSPPMPPPTVAVNQNTGMPPVTPPTAFPVKPPVPEAAQWQPSGPVRPMTPTAPVPSPDEGRRIIASSHGSAPATTAPGASYTPNPSYANPANPAGARPRGKLPEIQFVNTHHLELDYQVRVGPSGVGTVELWVTQDDGQTWKHFANDEDVQPPFVVDVPEDGPYGFMLIVKSRAGLGRKAPAPGDAPEVRLEVDTTAPIVSVFVPEADPKRRDTLQLLWTATDRNLGTNTKPVSWQWAESPEGPWRQIEPRDLANIGKHSWTMPPNLPYEVYLRVIVRDLAGNESTATTDRPVQVDLVEPEITFKGIKPPAPPMTPKPIGPEVPSARLPLAPPR